MTVDNAGWDIYRGHVVIVDTSSAFLYIGTLAEVNDHFVRLTDVDVHDRAETPTTKEQYLITVKRFGVKPNRKEVSIRKAVALSVSRLDDVVLY